MEKRDNLTQLQKIALEGEVSKALITARHNPEVLYRLYILLTKAPQDITPTIIEIFKEIVDIKEELVDRVVLEVSSGRLPMWLWIDRVIADIKLSISLAC